MAKGPSTTAPKLMSPVILRNSSVPLNDFVRLLEPLAKCARACVRGSALAHTRSHAAWSMGRGGQQKGRGGGQARACVLAEPESPARQQAIYALEGRRARDRV
jgi:hypothetical protein